MSHLDALLFARAHRLRRAVPRAALRHRHLVDEPMAVVAWQLGAEPFSAAAIAFGTSPAAPALAIAGDPRNRELAFEALLTFARWFVPRFERPAATVEDLGDKVFVATDAPQVVVINEGSLALLGRLGRRLAYLPTTGKWAADPLLVRLGRHLQFLGMHASMPGQQLVVVLAQLLRNRWATPQSDLERMSVPAVDAWIDPESDPWEAARLAEHLPVGPLPGMVATAGGWQNMDELLEPHLAAFLQARREGRSPIAAKTAIESHYRRFADPAWALLWKVHAREAAVPQAPSVARRWLEDRRAYTRHVDWTAKDRGRRTRQTTRQAVRTLRDLEAATARVQAEEACEDPLLIVPFLLDGEAVRGRVVASDRDRRVRENVRAVRRPRVVLAVDGTLRMPLGRELWWTAHPDDHPFVVSAIERAGSVTRMTLDAAGPAKWVPETGSTVDFSVLHTGPGFWTTLPDDDPWTHRTEPSLSIEEQP